MMAGVVNRDSIVITDIIYEMTSLAMATCSARKARAGGRTIQKILKKLARKRKKDKLTSAFL